MFKNVSFAELQQFFSPEGQALLIDIIREARETRGAGWLNSLKQEYPAFAEILDLVMEHDGPAALAHVKDLYPMLKLIGWADQPILELHSRLKAEIDRRN